MTAQEAQRLNKRLRAAARLADAVQLYLSAYASEDEMSDGARDLAAALAEFDKARKVSRA